MQIRDRIKSLRRVKAKDLIRNANNWRTHPDRQRSALNGILREVGYADALIARELRSGKLELIDGHLRVEEADPETRLPVLVLNVTAKEADKLLATLDPLAGMAEVDHEELDRLLSSLESDDEDVEQLVQFVAKKHRLPLDDNAPEEDEEAVRCTKCGQLLKSSSGAANATGQQRRRRKSKRSKR